MRKPSSSVDRRHAYRVQPRDAVAQCTTKRTTDLYAVHDLSRGGVALTGRTPMPSGSKANLRLMIPGYRTMSLRGTVLRTLPQPGRESRVAIEFGQLAPDDEDSISSLIVTELALGSLPRCLVASSSEREVRVLSARLEAIGVHVLQARTPMEVIHRLETSPRRVDAIVIGGQVGDCDGVEFASFVAGAYPGLRRVLTGRSIGRRAQLARHVAHTSLEGRWGADDLRMALLRRPSS